MPAPKLPFDPIAEAERQWVAHDLDEPSAMAAATALMRAHQLVTATVEGALRPFGLTFARFEVLTLLTFTRTGTLPMAKIGTRLMVHPTSITNSVDKLEAQGLVERRPHPTDRRTTLAAITPEGRRVAKKAAAVLTDVRFGMPPADGDVAQLSTALERLRAHHGDLPDA